MKYLKVWTSFRDIIQPLSDDEKGRLFVMMLIYAESFEEPADFAGNERFVWPAAKQWIDLTFAESIRLSENGKKGGRPKTKQNKTEATETNENQTKPNESHKVKENNIKENNVNISPMEKKRFTPPTLEEVTEYCRERGNNVNPQTFIDFYSSKGWRVGNQPMKDWKACVRTWEQRDKKPIKLLPAHDFEQRDYSDDQEQAMERLLNWKAGSV